VAGLPVDLRARTGPHVHAARVIDAILNGHDPEAREQVLRQLAEVLKPAVEDPLVVGTVELKSELSGLHR
jgi:hypothetical protein